MILDFYERIRAGQAWECKVGDRLFEVPYCDLVEKAYLQEISPADLVRRRNKLWREAQSVKELRQAFVANGQIPGERSRAGKELGFIEMLFWLLLAFLGF